MSNFASIIMHLFTITDIAFYFLIPALLVAGGFPIFYALLAGWTVGFFSPSVGLQHEWNHMTDRPWYTEVLFQIMQCFCLVGPLGIHHKHSHHKYANSEKDYGHPFKNRNKLEFLYNYTIQSLPALWKYHKIRLFFSVLGALVSSLIFLKLFGLIGILYQLGTILGFHYTVIAGNFIQHYGLEQLPIPQSEKVTYAWDDSGEIGKYIGFNLHVHTDHHMNALKPFDQLKNIKGRPMMPYSLPIMTLLVPFPLFGKIMNPRLEAYIKRFTT